jgi:uncharacterized protein YoaH (UPF0181 family)
MSTKMNISLPAPMKKWVERHAAAKGYETTDAFMLEMLRREKAAAARERIDDLLSEAISSGEPRSMTTKDWDRIRAAGLKRARGRQRK